MPDDLQQSGDVRGDESGEVDAGHEDGGRQRRRASDEEVDEGDADDVPEAVRN